MRCAVTAIAAAKMKRKEPSADTQKSPLGNSAEPAMEIVWQTPANPRKPKITSFATVKNRWAGKTVVDLFAEEFKGRPYEYFVSAVKSGRIQVDGQIVPVSYIVQSSQKISHFLHRHEPPVMAWDVSVLHEEPDILTVCKPASVPVHPCGQYRKNTVVGILQAERGLAPLFPVHRLDRLVSGLLIFARNADKADHFRQQIEGGLLRKEYIAKVVGAFPNGEQVVNANVDYNAREGRSSAEVPDQSNSKSIKGKTACTKFARISTNGHHSIVLCEPITGRTHQIRVHLQYIGHPIANDNLYLSNNVTARSVQGMGADRAAMPGSSQATHSPACAHGNDLTEKGDMHSSEEFNIDPMCTNCPNLAPRGYEGVEEGVWLHCWRYSGPGWSYECPYPEWATLG